MILLKTTFCILYATTCLQAKLFFSQYNNLKFSWLEAIEQSYSEQTVEVRIPSSSLQN